MKQSAKRVLSLVLCFAMLVGMLPAFALGALAAESGTQYLMFATDRHANTTVIGNIINNVESVIGEDELDYLALGGDMVGSGNNHPDYNSSTVLSEVTGATNSLTAENVDIVAGVHDMNVTDDAGIVLPYQGGGAQIYEGDGYYVYGVEEYCISEDSNESNWSAQAQAFVDWANGEDVDKSYAIFVSSHYPLHAKRNDNDGAYYWHQALNTVAAGDDDTVERNIVFFHGHNHTVDSNEYVYNVGDTMSIQSGNATVSDTIYYTYATAGYLAQNQKATLVTLTEDAITLTKYSTSGEGTVMTSVERVETAAEAAYINSIAVTTLPAKTVYDVGETLDTTGMVVTAAYSDGTTAEITNWYTQAVDMTTEGEKEVTVCYADNGITFKTTFTVTVEEQAAVGAVLTGIEIVSGPAKTEYLVSDALDITGMVVEATFSDGTVTTLEYAPFTDDGDGYTVGDFCMYHEMDYEAVVSYTYGDVTCTDTFLINVWEEDFSADETGVEVAVTEIGITGITAAPSSNANVEAALSGVMTGYVAYDIDLTFYEGYTTTNTTATVTLPIPEGVSNPVVYYVSDDGATVTNMGAVKGDGVVTFTTDHFSTYVVGESTEITVPDPTTATVTGATSSEEKTVYVLVSAPTANNRYLIVSGNSAGGAYALKENTTTGSSVTINAAANGISAPWIETTDETIMWNAASGMTFQSENGNYYLRQTSSSGSRSLTFSTSQSTNWTVGTNSLAYQGNRSTYYVTGGSTWSLSSSSANVYFYEEQTVTVTTSANGTYSIAGADVSKVVVEGTTAALSSTLTFVPESGATVTTDTSATAAYTLVEGGDPNGIISGISGNTVTFTGKYGKALVKVSYTMTAGGTDYTVDNYITVEATAPTYNIEISQDGTTASADLFAVRGVTATTTKQLSYLLTYEDSNGVQTVTPTNDITWSILTEESDAGIATIDQTGKLSFTGNDGAIKVKVSYKVDDNTSVEDIVTINVRKSNAVTPEESTTDFPRWPNEGAVRYDKTAQAVGNFSNTGVAQLELSMAGIPVKTGGAVDVVIMLDMTGSMSDTAMTAAEESAIAFAEQIVKNSDGTYNDSRIAILAFNSGSSSPYTYWSLGTVDSDDEWSSLCTAVRGASDDQVSGGTPYNTALAKCQEILTAAKTDGTGNDRQQFCVFVSDGGPTSYTYITNYDAVKAGTATSYTTSTASASGGSNQSDSNFATIATYTHEYYSTLMKDAGVTMYSVLTGLSAEDYPNCTTILQNIASSSDKAYVVEDGSDTSALTDAFTAIASEIKSAATNVSVADQITEHYEMIFDWPTAVKDENKVAGQEFYIEVVNYPLDDTTHERTGTSTILQRIYLNSAGTEITKITYTDASGNVVEQTIAPTFKAAAEGEDAYFNWTDTDGDGVAVAGEYSYAPDGDGTHHMATGAYVELNTDGTLKSLHGVYFTYFVETKTLNWTVTSMSEDSEIALRYFLYLTGSLESVANGLQEGDAGYVAPGTYLTNVEATLNYTNHLDNECLQYFPKPQLTWNGAQVSYVFYLVNEDGEPVNRAGRVVTFAEAVFVTDIYTQAVVWNEEEGVTELNATKVAQQLLPADYTLYDSTTEYAIHVYQDADGTTIYNWFEITAGNGTTKVYNTKAGTKYDQPGTYTSAMESMDGFDFANTTVAFAVVWEKQLVEDTVVVDFGLPVDIDVVSNDFVYNYISGIGASDPNYGINKGYKTDTPALTASELTVDGHGIKIQDQNHIRFIPGNGTSMEFDAPVSFYYETTVEAYENSQVVESYMYSKVTVIPATTVYYEDSFLDLTSYTKDTDGNFVEDATSQWTTDGTTVNATQDQDRPGASQISADIDADNNYGYDSAYKTLSTHSMGSAAKINVDASTRGEATFTFYGTGFDVIGMTSNATGTLIVQLYSGASATGDALQSLVVDTYYGYTRDANGDWVVSVNDPNALYQVPVMQMNGLTYGQYTVKIIAGYNSYFENVEGSTDYDLYLDAIRIYDPTGNTNDVANDAYVADGEGWPQYTELRNNIIAASNYTVTENEDGTVTVSGTNLSGAIFIDSSDATTSIVDYVSYGPNNELYLASGQSVSFALDQTYASIIADVQIAMKLGNGSSVAYEMYNAATDGTKSNTKTGTLTTATDLYYSIKDLASGTIVISNTSGGILSITNIKVTYTQNPYSTSASSEEDLNSGIMTTSLYVDEEVATAAVMSLRSMPVIEEPEVEETEPETEATEPETTEPETEATEPETEETIPEPTEPEDTESGDEVTEAVEKVVEIIKKLFGWLFG